MAYVAAVMAHPAFTARFASDLVRPSLRVPITADASLFAEAVALGSEVKQAPRLPKESTPYIPAGGTIPSAPEPLPDEMEYDPATRRLKIGRGYVANVTPEMSALRNLRQAMLWHWFSYRRRDRSRPIIGDRRPPSPLDLIHNRVAVTELLPRNVERLGRSNWRMHFIGI